VWCNVESAYQLYRDRAADSTGVAEKVPYIVLRERRAERKKGGRCLGILLMKYV